MADYREEYVDYSEGRSHAPTMTVMVGMSGSGKSTLVKGWVTRAQGNIVRFNRDETRLMLFADAKWSNYNEELTRRYEREGVKLALRMRRDVIVDDTNLVYSTRNGWEELARDLRVKYRLVVMTTPVEECLKRNAARTGTERVPDDAMQRQQNDLAKHTVTCMHYDPAKPNRALTDREALQGGELPRRLPTAKYVLCDIDGTLANHIRQDGSLIRSPFDEKRVLEDECHTVVADWIRELYKSYNVIIISGRHDTCGEGTVMWLQMHNIPFDTILMRPGGNNDKDYNIKREILDELLAVISPQDIAFVLDDRPQVVRMWRENGLKVFPVAGTTEHSDKCTFTPEKNGWRKCPECWALEDF